MASTIWGGVIGLAVVLAFPAMAQEDAQGGAGVTVSAEEIVGDAAAGERVFRRCSACHEVGEGAENKVGPHLDGVVGRPAGSLADYEYSEEMVEAGAAGLVWTVADLQAYLEKPRDVVPGTKMNFPGLRSEEQRNDVIAYLHEAGTGSGGQ